MEVSPKIRSSCRVCGFAQMKDILSLGNQFVTNFVDSPQQEQIRIPLELIFCNNCKLLQLRHTTPSEILYRQYWYKSGISTSMRAALADVVNKAIQMVDLDPYDIVIDIGSNDGTTLRLFPKNIPLTLVGFEPAKNLIEESQIGTSVIINDFFNYDSYKKIFGNKKAKIITAVAMFYDLEDPNKFVDDIVNCLHSNGVFIIQMNYLMLMLEQNAFDNISHEHLEYYSLESLRYLLNKHDLEIFDVELNNVNGGSFRVYVKHKGASVKTVDAAENRIKELMERERKMMLNDAQTYIDFAKRINILKEKVHGFIEQEVKNGKTIYIRGSSTRGNVTLQFFGIDHRLIKKAGDRNKDKYGKYIVGTEIPIVPVEQAMAEKPDYFLVLPWHFIDELVGEAKDYLNSGGKFIVPMPEFKIIGSS